MKLRVQGLRLSQGAFNLSASAQVDAPSLGFCGASGSGKTTLLECLAGLRRPQQGSLSLDGVTLDDAAAGLHVPARARGFGYVPQDADLFPHLDVEANLRFGQGAHGLATDWDDCCEWRGLWPLLDRSVDGLSGGERRRVALGRALFSGARLLLLDEPFSGLDAAAKRELRAELKAVQRRLRLPMVLVSHEAADLKELCVRRWSLDSGSLRAG